MEIDPFIARAYAVFQADWDATPQMSLRGGYAESFYDIAPPYDPLADEPTDAYLETHTFWGYGFLDPASWRHYLPRLIEYALGHLEDPRMVVEGLLHCLRPPDREPPRLASLTPDQEAVIVEFLEQAAFHPASGNQDFAMQVLEEWWLPDARYRNPKKEDKMTFPFVAANDQSRQRLEALLDRLAAQDLARVNEDGWTVAATLAHLAFWDQRMLVLLRRWKANGVDESPVDSQMMNDALLPILLALDPREAVRLCRASARAIDAELESLSPELVAQIEAGPTHFRFNRSLHRGGHLDGIEKLLAI